MLPKHLFSFFFSGVLLLGFAGCERPDRGTVDRTTTDEEVEEFQTPNGQRNQARGQQQNRNTRNNLR